MDYLITGGTGFIGQALVKSLLDSGASVTVLTRDPAKLKRLYAERVQGVCSLEEVRDEATLDGVVNLAGEPIADKRWSEARKQLIYDSRLQMTSDVLALIKRLQNPPSVLVSGSAIGFYGPQVGQEPLIETGRTVPGFTHKLCSDWEQKALAAEDSGVRVCLLRTGVVLGHGGALARMLPPFKCGLGGAISRGTQWMSWVHLDDIVAIIRFLLEHAVLSGPFNATAPTPVTNRVFSDTLAASLGRPAWMTVPAFVINLMLGEGAELLLEGQRVVPDRLLQAGFQFHYPELKPALQSIVN